MNSVENSESMLKSCGLHSQEGAASAAQGRIDPLLRLNLPFLLGRRDAALDAAEEFAGRKFFSGEHTRWKKYCGTLLKLIRSAAADTETISSLLSSPDTQRRERRMLRHISMLECVATALENISSLSCVMFDREEQEEEEEEFAGYEEKLREEELHLLEWLRKGFCHARSRQNRYRAYAQKSFNAENAERYHLAYDSSCRMFLESATTANNVNQ